MCGRLLEQLSGITFDTGNSLSAIHSSQQSHGDNVSTSVQPVVSIQETDGTAFSGSVSDPQSRHGFSSSHIIAGPTRNVTDELMPISLAEASRSCHSLISYSAG